jgi:hypothetical protein
VPHLRRGLIAPKVASFAPANDRCTPLLLLYALAIFVCHPRRGSASALVFAVACFCPHPERSEG